MMVKNESASLKAVLESVKPYIDWFTIVDTESTDNTKDIITETLPNGVLFSEPFIGYAQTRNRTLDLAKTAGATEFLLVLSGDEYLKDGVALREYLEIQRNTNVDAFKVRLTLEDTTLCPIRVFRTGSNWRYEDNDCGVHEYPTNSNPSAPISTIPKTSLDHIVSDPEKRYSNIWENHIPLLKAALERNPNNDRALIFLASSYESLLPFMEEGERITYSMKTMSLYMRRLALHGGSDAERNYIKMRLLDNAKNLGIYNDAEFFARCNELCSADPKRPETALLRVNAAMRCLPVTQVYDLAVDAARVADEAQGIENESPVSTSCGWKARLIAAKAAKQISVKFPDSDFADRAKEQAKAGITAGGPDYLFESVISDAQAVA